MAKLRLFCHVLLCAFVALPSQRLISFGGTRGLRSWDYEDEIFDEVTAVTSASVGDWSEHQFHWKRNEDGNFCMSWEERSSMNNLARNGSEFWEFQCGLGTICQFDMNTHVLRRPKVLAVTGFKFILNLINTATGTPIDDPKSRFLNSAEIVHVLRTDDDITQSIQRWMGTYLPAEAAGDEGVIQYMSTHVHDRVTMEVSRRTRRRSEARAMVSDLRNIHGQLFVGIGETVSGVEWSSGPWDVPWLLLPFPVFDATDPADFAFFFGRTAGSVDRFKAEHVFEHLSLTEAVLAARNCFTYLKAGGVLRVAVPDYNYFLFSPNRSHSSTIDGEESGDRSRKRDEIDDIDDIGAGETVGNSGLKVTTSCSHWFTNHSAAVSPEFDVTALMLARGVLDTDIVQGHRLQYTLTSLSGLLRSVGFEVEAVEWTDEQGELHISPWSPLHGHIHRSSKGASASRSIIVDAIKPKPSPSVEPPASPHRCPSFHPSPSSASGGAVPSVTSGHGTCLHLVIDASAHHSDFIFAGLWRWLPALLLQEHAWSPARAFVIAPKNDHSFNAASTVAEVTDWTRYLALLNATTTGNLDAPREGQEPLGWCEGAGRDLRVVVVTPFCSALGHVVSELKSLQLPSAHGTRGTGALHVDVVALLWPDAGFEFAPCVDLASSLSPRREPATPVDPGPSPWMPNVAMLAMVALSPALSTAAVEALGAQRVGEEEARVGVGMVEAVERVPVPVVSSRLGLNAGDMFMEADQELFAFRQLCASSTAFTGISTDVFLRGPYVVTSGETHWDPHTLQVVLRCLSEARMATSNVQRTIWLVIVGGATVGAPLANELSMSGVWWVQVRPSVEIARKMFSGALAFVYLPLSVDQGLARTSVYSTTVLNALACGCPVVLSDMPELVTMLPNDKISDMVHFISSSESMLWMVLRKLNLKGFGGVSTFPASVENITGEQYFSSHVANRRYYLASWTRKRFLGWYPLAQTINGLIND